MKPSDDLRAKAETRLEKLIDETDLSSSEDVKKLVHELKVHQIELEIQNEELRNTRDILLASKNRYYNLYHHDPVGHVTVDANGSIKMVNRSFAGLLKTEPDKITGRFFYRFIDENDQGTYLLWFKKIIESEIEQTIEINLKKTSGPQKRLQLTGRTNLVQTNEERVIKEVVITAFDMTELKEKQRKIEELNQRMDSAIEVGNLAWWFMDIESGKVSFHPHKTELLGYQYEDFEGKSYQKFTRLIHPEDEPLAMQAMRDHIEGRAESYTVEYRIKAADGSYRWFRDFGKKLEKTTDQTSQGVIGIALDITGRKAREEQIKMSEARFRAIFEQTSAGIAIADADRNLLDVNEALCAMLGYNREELLGKSIAEFTYPEDREQDGKAEGLMKDGDRSAIALEKRYLHKNGNPVWAKLEYNVVRDSTGEIQYSIGVVTDINERIKAEEALQNALAEKEGLLKEIHHRVKNNLAVVSSLLKLQSNRTTNEQAKASLMDSSNRVQSMASIHESLYQSESLAKVDMKTYLSKLGKQIAENYSIAGNVKLVITADDTKIEPKQASTIGLIVNELITNSFKYAFPDNMNGEINISSRSRDHQLELVYSDNGVGFPEDYNWQESNSMGLSLVKMLTERQLKGSIVLDNKNGSQFTLLIDLDV